MYVFISRCNNGLNDDVLTLTCSIIIFLLGLFSLIGVSIGDDSACSEYDCDFNHSFFYDL